MTRPVYFLYAVHFSIECEMFQTKRCRENQNAYFMLDVAFSTINPFVR